MCGIAGFSLKANLGQKENVLRIMNDKLSHRGPDGEGYYHDSNVSFSHKRLAIIEQMKRCKVDIFSLVDTRWSETVQRSLRKTHSTYSTHFAGNNSQSRGVAIFINRAADITIKKSHADPDGNFLLMELIIGTTPTLFCALYGPNRDDPEWWANAIDTIHELDYENILLAGDFNVTLNPDLDNLNYKTDCNPLTRQFFQILITDNILCDSFRQLYPNTKNYTFQTWSGNKQARLDMFLASPTMQNYITEVVHLNSKRIDLDHKMIMTTISFDNFTPGKGSFRVPPHLHTDPEYIQLINNVIEKTTKFYSLDDETDPNSASDINLLFAEPDDLAQYTSTCPPDVLFEMILMESRTFSIEYIRKKAQQKKKLRTDIEAKLETQTKKVEDFPDNIQAREELNRTKYIYTEMEDAQAAADAMKIKTEWKMYGEKPSKWFINLCKQKSASSTISKLLINQDTPAERIVKTQKEVIHEAEMFYRNLFTRINTTDEIDNFLNSDEDDIQLKLLTAQATEELERPVTQTELATSLKHANNNSSPGIDGFTAGWAKCFWSKLKNFYFNSIQHAITTKQLSCTLRQGIITLIPKGKKDRTLLTNWRPITLLSVWYKILSGVYAARLKNSLPKLIHYSQTAYLGERQMGDAVMNIYQTLLRAKIRNVAGIVLLVDFNKAFDSIDHDYLYKVLGKSGYGPNFISGIKLLLTERYSCVTLSGHLTNRFKLERGVPQGDPVSAYLFIIAVEVLALKLRETKSIKKLIIDGITIDNALYADDLTIVLADDPASLRAAIRIIQHFGKISGLTINSSKTQVAHIGSAIGTPDICPELELKWKTEFKLLGLTMDVNLENLEQNFRTAWEEITKSVGIWKRRTTTPLGRLVVLKTLLLSKLTFFAILMETPDENTIKLINNQFNQFVWNCKVNKISHERMTSSIQNGGLNMIDIGQFWKSLKVSWIRRGIDSQMTWAKLLTEDLKTNGIDNIKTLLYTTDYALKKIAEKLYAPIWKETVTYLADLRRDYVRSLGRRILNESIFENTLFARQGRFLDEDSKVIRKTEIPRIAASIAKVSDLISENGLIMTSAEIREKFGFTPPWPTYDGIRTTIKTNIVKYDIRPIEDPYRNFANFVTCKKGTRRFRNAHQINKQKLMALPLIKSWHEKLNFSEQHPYWKQAFVSWHKLSITPEMKHLQLRILNRILGVGTLIAKFNWDIDTDCKFCKKVDIKNDPQLITTLDKLRTWHPFLAENFPQTTYEMLLHKHIDDPQDRITINTISSIVKYYIWSCRFRNALPGPIGLKAYLKFHVTLINSTNDFKGNNVLMTQIEFLPINA